MPVRIDRRWLLLTLPPEDRGQKTEDRRQRRILFSVLCPLFSDLLGLAGCSSGEGSTTARAASPRQTARHASRCGRPSRASPGDAEGCAPAPARAARSERRLLEPRLQPVRTQRPAEAGAPAPIPSRGANG